MLLPLFHGPVALSFDAVDGTLLEQRLAAGAEEPVGRDSKDCGCDFPQKHEKVDS